MSPLTGRDRGVVIQVVGRNVFAVGLPWAEELATEETLAAARSIVNQGGKA